MLKDGTNKVGKNEVAHFVNDYFINIGRAAEPSAPAFVRNVDTQGPQVAPVEGWRPEEFTVKEVLKLVTEIHVSKSSGLTNISSYVLKVMFTILAPQVTFMLNLSMKSAIFPQAWKEALVIPIPKGGNLTQVKNYRPISLLPLPGKILEKLMHKQLSEHIDENSLLTENQYGFRKGRSTIHSVAQLTGYIDKKMDKKLPTLATFIDFRKAFDCVQHPVLLDNLSKLGLDCKVVDWFRSYLTNRRQRVLANNVYSSAQTVTQGVPQGSVLGPLFYILYANDITNIIEHCNIALYADDTVLYTANPNFNNLIQ